MYMMPAHFGPRRAGGKASGWYHDVTTMIVPYLTDPEKLAAILPAPFAVADEPVITVTYACSKEVDWLAGRGYNLVSVTAAAVFDGEEDHLTGTYALAVWENLADPILTGRELTGIPKIYADIPDHSVDGGVWRCGASHFGNRIVDLAIRELRPPTPAELAAYQAATEGKDNPMGLRYLPGVGGFGEALCEATLFPTENVVNEALVGSGEVDWNHLSWEENPTQFYIVNALADLPVLQYLPALVTRGSTNLLVPDRMARVLR